MDIWQAGGQGHPLPGPGRLHHQVPGPGGAGLPAASYGRHGERGVVPGHHPGRLPVLPGHRPPAPPLLLPQEGEGGRSWQGLAGCLLPSLLQHSDKGGAGLPPLLQPGLPTAATYTYS